MDVVLKSSKLSEMENKEPRIGWLDGKKIGVTDPKVIAFFL
jgi:hypothetical protein